MGRYKVTTESGSYIVTTEDAQSSERKPSFGGAASAEAGLLPAPGTMPMTSIPRPGASGFEIEAGASKTPNVPAEMKSPAFLGRVKGMVQDFGVDGARQALSTAFSAIPNANQIIEPLIQAVTNPGQALEMAPAAGAVIGGTTAAFGGPAAIPGGMALGGAAGKAYEIAGKAGLEKLGLPGGDRPTQPTVFGMKVPRIPGLPVPVSDVVVEGGLQGAPEGIMRGALKVASLPSTKLGQRMASAVFGPDADAIAERMARPGAIKNAKTFSTIADEIPARLTKLQDEISALDTEAWKTLSVSNDPLKGAIPKSEIVDTLKGILRENRITGGGAIGPAQKKAVAMVNGLLEDISGVGSGVKGKLTSEQGVKSIVKKSDFVSEARMKEIIQALRDNVDYSSDAANRTNSVLMNAAESLDKSLKLRNDAYKQAMIPVADRMDLLERAKTDFGVKHKTGKGFIRTDATVSKVKSILSDRKDVSRETLSKLAPEVKGEIADATTKTQFEGGRIQGSRRVNLGGAIGAGLGSLAGLLTGRNPMAMATGAGVGSMAGTMTGAYIDKQGGPMVAKLIDAYLRNNPRNINPVPASSLSQFLQTLKSANP